MRGDEGMRDGEGVGEEDGAVERVAGGGIDGVEGKCEDDDNQRVDPCVVEGEVLPAADVGAGFSAFGVWARDFGLGIAL